MKLKTSKSMSKRIKVTKNGKMLKRKAGQAHFNSRDNGKASRNKRRDITMAKTMGKLVADKMSHA